MKLETRRRITREGLKELVHFDLVLLPNKAESKLIDQLGQPGTTFTGEVRLADGYGEHYLLVQPKHIVGVGWERDL